MQFIVYQICVWEYSLINYAQIKSQHFFDISPIYLVTLPEVTLWSPRRSLCDHHEGHSVITNWRRCTGDTFWYKSTPNVLIKPNHFWHFQPFYKFWCVLIFHIFKQSTWHKILNGRMLTITRPHIHYRTMYQAVHRKERKQKHTHFNSKFDMHHCQIRNISKLKNDLQKIYEFWLLLETIF